MSFLIRHSGESCHSSSPREDPRAQTPSIVIPAKAGIQLRTGVPSCVMAGRRFESADILHRHSGENRNPARLCRRPRLDPDFRQDDDRGCLFSFVIPVKAGIQLREGRTPKNSRRYDDVKNANEPAQTIYCPPLADSVEPVMKPAPSLARNTTQRATSCGSPSRPVGICGMMVFSRTSLGTAITISVAI
jgi:hypothetical protein